MEEGKKQGRYDRLFIQLEKLTRKTENPLSRMSTICAVLHHKMDYYFWTGFYLLKSGKLLVGPYQGPLACQELAPHKGVCWAAVDRNKPVVVDDVHSFPGHLACDSRSNSEICLPVWDLKGEVVAVFDVDSDKKASFSKVDSENLEKILSLIHRQIP